MKGALPILLLTLVVAANNAAAMVQPWFLLSSRIKAALEGDKYVDVFSEKLGHKVQVTITVASCCKSGRRLAEDAGTVCIPGCKAAKSKAWALSTLLFAATQKNNNDNWSTQVQIRVMQDGLAVLPGKAPTLAGSAAGVFTSAMLGNEYFLAVEVRPPYGVANLKKSRRYATFEPYVSQYYSGDSTQKEGLTTVVAADLMESVFRLSDYGLGVNTDICNGEDCLFPVDNPNVPKA